MSCAQSCAPCQGCGPVALAGKPQVREAQPLRNFATTPPGGERCNLSPKGRGLRLRCALSSKESGCVL